MREVDDAFAAFGFLIRIWKTEEKMVLVDLTMNSNNLSKKLSKRRTCNLLLALVEWRMLQKPWTVTSWLEFLVTVPSARWSKFLKIRLCLRTTSTSSKSHARVGVLSCSLLLGCCPLPLAWRKKACRVVGLMGQ